MSVTVLVTQVRPSLPGGMPWVELPRFLVRIFQFNLLMHLLPFLVESHRKRSSSQMCSEPVECGAGGYVELAQIGVEVPPFDQDQFLGLECTFVRGKLQIGQ